MNADCLSEELNAVWLPTNIPLVNGLGYTRVLKSQGVFTNPSYKICKLDSRIQLDTNNC